MGQNTESLSSPLPLNQLANPVVTDKFKPRGVISLGSQGLLRPYYLLANEHAKFLHKSARELIHHDSGLMKEAGRTFCNHRGLNRGRFVLICTFLYVLLCVRTDVLVRRYFCNHRGGEEGADLRP